MEDELEDKVLYQTFISHMKLLSKYGVGLPLNTTFLSYFWRILRLYIIRPEVIILSSIVFVTCLYLQSFNVWSRGLFDSVVFSLDKSKKILKPRKPYGGESWEFKSRNVGVYSIQGRRANMEDRFAINENINNTGISLFAIFDGHGGVFAANYAQETLIKNLNERLVEIKKLKEEGGGSIDFTSDKTNLEAKENLPKEENTKDTVAEKKASFGKKAYSTDEELDKSDSVKPDPYVKKILGSLTKPIRNFRKSSSPAPKKVPLQSYLDASKFSGIDYGKIINDEVLEIDRLILYTAKKYRIVAGSTALIALMEGSHLLVANVGDSRGVMCDSKGNAIPLSFDHKPQQTKESKRIKEAGGFISFNGVWRVAGVLAVSRALGDYPLKEKNLVIAEPDILTFDLSDHKPLFIILASDGLWDTFTNEEAVAFIKEHLDEPYYGAKSIALRSYNRGSHDNITVVVINLAEKKWSSYTMNSTLTKSTNTSPYRDSSFRRNSLQVERRNSK